MTDSSTPSGVRIVQLDQATLSALAAGDLLEANRHVAFDLPAWFAPPGDDVWEVRSRQVDADPSCLRWVTGAVLDATSGAVVGFAGYHGPPDDDGLVEIGYDVGPPVRRRGYGHAIVDALLARAAREPDVHTVRARINPDNLASRTLIGRHGFRQVGEPVQTDDKTWLVFEVRS